jgi:LysM repeat protein
MCRQPCGGDPATATLQPYHPTSTQTPASESAATLAILPTAGASPTPQAYAVRANDTLLGIALVFGLSREELLAANPGLNPDLLSIGQQLLIPVPGGQGTATPIPTPTPLPLQIAEPRCFPSTSGGLWCLVGVTNTTGAAVGQRAPVAAQRQWALATPFTRLNLPPADQVIPDNLPAPPVPALPVVRADDGCPRHRSATRPGLSTARSQPSDRGADAGVSIRLPVDRSRGGSLSPCWLSMIRAGDRLQMGAGGSARRGGADLTVTARADDRALEVMVEALAASAARITSRRQTARWRNPCTARPPRRPRS